MTFKVGDRIRSKQAFEPPATVTEITTRGFKYKFDEPHLVGPARWGQYSEGGEHYLDVYPNIQFWILEKDWTPEFSKMKMYITNDKGESIEI